MDDGIPMPNRLILLGTLVAATAAVGCANHIGTTAASFLNKASTSTDPNVRHVAYQKLGNPNVYDSEQQKGGAAQLLDSKLQGGTEPIASRVEICRVLGRLRRPESRDAVAKACDDDEPIVRAEACRAMGAVGKPDDVPVLSRHMTSDTSVDCRIAAIEGLGALKVSDPQVELQLVDGMEHEDPAIRVASLRALRSISGQDFGPGPEPWRKYAMTRLDRSGGVAPPTVDRKAAPPATAEVNPTRSPVLQ